MKKGLIVLLTSAAVLASAVTAAACASKRPAAPKTSAPAAIRETAAPQTEEIINDGQNPAMNFVGNYYGGRASVNVEADGADGAKVTVTWGSSYDTKAVWTMSGTFDGEKEILAYENAVKKLITLDENGEIISEETLYSGGQGVFVFSYDGVTWDDHNENIAENLVFIYEA